MLFALASMFACGGRATFDDGDAAGTSGVAGANNAASASSAGGEAETGICRANSDCPKLQGFCAANVCSSGKCQRVASPEGSSKHPHQPADCFDDVCDGMGGVKSIPDVANVPVSTNPCTALYCDVTGISYFRALPLRTSCGSGSTQRFCDGSANCVSCITLQDCAPTEHCNSAHDCVPD
ncbi:MAG TPA: hypothetical protein VGM44_11425 [Polyangiaceae bacterium]